MGPDVVGCRPHTTNDLVIPAVDPCLVFMDLAEAKNLRQIWTPSGAYDMGTVVLALDVDFAELAREDPPFPRPETRGQFCRRGWNRLGRDVEGLDRHVDGSAGVHSLSSDFGGISACVGFDRTGAMLSWIIDINVTSSLVTKVFLLKDQKQLSICLEDFQPGWKSLLLAAV